MKKEHHSYPEKRVLFMLKNPNQEIAGNILARQVVRPWTEVVQVIRDADTDRVIGRRTIVPYLMAKHETLFDTVAYADSFRNHSDEVFTELVVQIRESYMPIFSSQHDPQTPYEEQRPSSPQRSY